jgi:hypothetical protein
VDIAINAVARLISENTAILTLVAIVLFGMWCAVRMQLNGSIRWQEGFTDNEGCIDWMRTAVLISLVASTWILCTLTNDFVENAGELDALFKWYVLYLGVWSGAPIVTQLVEIAKVRYGVPTEPPKP